MGRIHPIGLTQVAKFENSNRYTWLKWPYLSERLSWYRRFLALSLCMSPSLHLSLLRRAIFPGSALQIEVECEPELLNSHFYLCHVLRVSVVMPRPQKIASFRVFGVGEFVESAKSPFGDQTGVGSKSENRFRKFWWFWLFLCRILVETRRFAARFRCFDAISRVLCRRHLPFTPKLWESSTELIKHDKREEGRMESEWGKWLSTKNHPSRLTTKRENLETH